MFQRSPGAECVGGLEVEISTPASDRGVLNIERTLWPNDDPAGDLSRWTEPALRGINDYFEALSLDSSHFDIVLRRFLVHEVDSMPTLYYVAAQNALESALRIQGHELPDPTRNHS